jgi:phage gpG-like protein
MRITITGLDEAFSGLRVQQELLLRKVGDASLPFLQEPFIRGTDPYGRPFLPVKSRHGLSRPLVLTGAMRDSLNAYRISGSSVEFETTNIPYASYHQFGTEKIPRRQFLPDVELNDRWIRVIESVLLDAIND